MKRYVLGAAAILTMVLCLSFSSIQAKAAGPRDGEIVDGSLLTSELEASDSFENVLRSAFLAMGVSQISNRSNGLIYIGGDTYCFQTCAKVKIFLYLERLVGDVWEPVFQKSKSESEAYYAGDGVYLTVETGSYYRIRGTHTAIYENDSQACYTLTNGIYVD